MTVPICETFEAEKKHNIAALGADAGLRQRSVQWIEDVSQHQYSYNFKWMGLPIIQFPQDIVAMQEIIWAIRPDLIIETGIARGGSLIFYASMLQMAGVEGRVIGVDIDIRDPNRDALESHPMRSWIELIEGSSTDPQVVERIAEYAAQAQRPLVVLDSNHTHDHVLEELRLYSPLVRVGSYLVVMDTIVEDLPPGFASQREWDPGNSPKTAVHEFLTECDRFEIDKEIENKLLITVAPDGYLRCVRD